MSTLRFLLQHQDPVFRRLVAEAWGIERPEDWAWDPESLSQELARQDVIAVLETLPEEAVAALRELVRQGGTLPWMSFVRRYGPLRPIGPSRMTEEAPHLRPASPLEALWYRALIGRRLETREEEVEEVVYIPQEWLTVLEQVFSDEEVQVWGRPALAEEIAHPRPVTTALVDDLTTLLAGWRQGRSYREMAPFLHENYPSGWVRAFCQAWGLVSLGTKPIALNLERVRDFLHMEEGEALLLAFHTWVEARFHDVLFVRSWRPVGPLPGDASWPRRWLLKRLQSLPQGTWWSLPGFIDAVRRREPDFAVPDADLLERWRFQEADTHRIFTWYTAWDQVAGALLRFLITGPLHWLGLVDVAHQAFRLSPWFDAFLQNRPPPIEPYQGRLLVRMDGTLVVPRRAPRWVRYQVARAGEWLPRGPRGEYLYRWTPRSLNRAREQSLKARVLIRLLQEHGHGVPQPLLRGLQRWEEGQVARVETICLLRLPSPQALEELRQSPAGQEILEVLGPALAVIRPGSEDRVLQALWNLGYLGEIVDIQST